MKYFMITLTSMLILSGCTPKGVTIANIPLAENIHFSEDNRLFVTGDGLYEIVNDGTISDVDYNSSFQAKSIHTNDCFATGIAELQDWLFFACGDNPISPAKEPNELWALSLSTDALVKVGVLENFMLANGILVLDEKTLLIANWGALPGKGTIGKVGIDFSSGSPQISQNEWDWGTSEHGLVNPNGLKMQGDTLYISDNNKLKVLNLDSDDNILSIETINAINAPTPILYDDIAPYDGYLLAASFVEGKINIVDIEEECVSQSITGFFTPSSIWVGQAEYQGKLLITEKYGNRLTYINIDEIDALLCE